MSGLRQLVDPPQDVGTDSGLLDQPVALGRRGKQRDGALLLAPAERADIIVDFADFAHETLVVLNSANAPYPSGDPPDPKTNGQIMQFRLNLPRQGRTRASIHLHHG